jgi:hypothetical protein
VLLSLVLFGSRARGDHRQSSDVDVLGIVETGTIRDAVAARGTAFYHYPLSYLSAKAISGDLFLLHLVTEGKILHDTAGLTANLFNSFQYKNNYDQEIREASAVVWFLVRRPEMLQRKALRRRLVWGLRTILIARAAQERRPAFSSAALSEYAQTPSLKSLIDKRSTVPIELLCSEATIVANKFGLTKADLTWPSDRAAQRALMDHLGGIAAATAQSVVKPRIFKKSSNNQSGTLISTYL